MALPAGAAMLAAWASASAIASGLGTSLCFGTGDFLAQRLTRCHGALTAMFGVQVASALLLVVIAFAWHGAPELSGQAIVRVAQIGAVNTVGMIGLYRAFERGQLSLVSPIAGSMGAFTVAFAWLAGHPPPPGVGPGLALVIVGIVVASVIVEPSPTGRRASAAAGIGWALLSALCLGWVFSVIGPSSEAIGVGWTVMGLRVVAILGLVALARPLRVRLDLAPLEDGPEELAARSRGLGRVAAVACLDSGGLLLYTFGSARAAAAGQLAIVAVLASGFPLVTISLAQVQLRERLRGWQWLGIVAVLVGVGWVAASSS